MEGDNQWLTLHAILTLVPLSICRSRSSNATFIAAAVDGVEVEKLSSICTSDPLKPCSDPSRFDNLKTKSHSFDNNYSISSNLKKGN